jgi:hypothetical protein
MSGDRNWKRRKQLSPRRRPRQLACRSRRNIDGVGLAPLGLTLSGLLRCGLLFSGSAKSRLNSSIAPRQFLRMVEALAWGALLEVLALRPPDALVRSGHSSDPSAVGPKSSGLPIRADPSDQSGFDVNAQRRHGIDRWRLGHEPFFA